MESILILCSVYNGEKYLNQQINSILHQQGVITYLIIRDDGSSDNSLKLLNELYIENPNRIRIIAGKNLGCSKSFYTLLLEATKETKFSYVAFADQDDVWMKDKLVRAVEKLRLYGSDSISLYSSNLLVVDKNLNVLGKMWPERTNYSIGNSLIESYAAGCTVVFTNGLLRFFLQHLPGSFQYHDKWLFHSCLLFGNLIYDENAYILYRQHGNNVEGAGFTLKDKIKHFLYSISQIKKQNYKEEEAVKLLSVYSNELSDEQLELLEIIAYYRNDIKKRLKFLRGYKGLSMNGVLSNLKLKIRIIIGKV